MSMWEVFPYLQPRTCALRMRCSSLRNIVALLAWSASHCSVFLHLTRLPLSATGSGKLLRPTEPYQLIWNSFASAFILYINVSYFASGKLLFSHLIYSFKKAAPSFAKTNFCIWNFLNLYFQKFIWFFHKKYSFFVKNDLIFKRLNCSKLCSNCQKLDISSFFQFLIVKNFTCQNCIFSF